MTKRYTKEPQNLGTRLVVKNRHGVTLLEVVAGLAMLGALLTVMMIAAGQFEKKRSRALQKLQAVRAADSLMTTFFTSGFPSLGSQGPIAQHPSWRWELSGREELSAPALLANVQLKIRDSKAEQRVLASIEVVTSKNSLGRMPALKP